MDAVKNFGYTTVATAPSPASSGTSLVVTDGTVFPAVPFNAVVWPVDANAIPGNAEIVRVTNISTNTLTITRAQEGTSARSIVAGDQISAPLTKVWYDELVTAAHFERWEGSFDGQQQVLQTGAKLYRRVKRTGTIAVAELLGDVSGSVTVTVKRGTPSAGSCSFSTTLGTVALSSAQHTSDSTLTGWTKSVTAGDWLEISIGGTISSIKFLSVYLST